MKFVYMFSLLFFITTFLSQSSFAIVEREGRILLRERTEQKENSEPDMVSWIGIIKDEDGSHNSDHDHKLQFIRDDGDTFDIVDSPELVKLHHETERNYKIEIEAEITSKFLFWGGNLIVKSFKVIEPSGAKTPHLSPEETKANQPKPVRSLKREI